MAVPLQAPYAQFFDSNGDPLAGGKVYTYSPGTTTPKATYTDAGGLTPASNPIILDSSGRAAIWIVGTYRIDVYTSADVLVRSTDEVPAFAAGGDMTKAVYDPANIAQQLVGLTAVQTITNKTVNGVTLTAVGSSTQFLNGAGSYATPIFSIAFTSTDQTITANSTLTLAHSLGAIPKFTVQEIICQSTDQGYAANDIVAVDRDNDQGWGIYYDSTNIYVNFGASATLRVYHKTTHADSGVDITKWKLRVKAWA